MNIRQRVKSIDRATGQRVRALRESHVPPLSQAAVAAKVSVLFRFGWHQTTVGDIERGKRPLKIGEAVGLAYVLDVPVTDLIEEPEAGDNRAAIRELRNLRVIISARQAELEES